MPVQMYEPFTGGHLIALEHFCARAEARAENYLAHYAPHLEARGPFYCRLSRGV